MVNRGNLQVAAELDALVTNDIAPGTGVEVDAFWAGLEQLLDDLVPKNAALLERRDELQTAIDAWHTEHQGQAIDPDEYHRFLTGIGYLVADPGDFQISTTNVDDEIALIAGPQLVVPVMNARYAINAANARWGSLYDAYFLSDIHPEIDRESQRPARLRMVVEETNSFLDQHVAAWQNGVGFGSIESFLVRSDSNG
ncbi:MAG: malate synthase G, partial [Pseudomonadales bacterium]